MGGPLGDVPEPLSREAIQELQSWMVSSYGSTRELDYLAAMHGQYGQPVDEELIEAEDRERRTEAVRDAVLDLPMIEAGIITKRYGLWDTETMKLRELGAALGVSCVMIHKREKRAKVRLKESPALEAMADEWLKNSRLHTTYVGEENLERAA